MNIYELISEIAESSKRDYRCDGLPYAFIQSNRAKLEDASDIEAFGLIAKAYDITILYSSDRRDINAKNDYLKSGTEGLVSFTNDEIKMFKNLDWAKLPHNLKAQVFDVIWLCNHDYTAAITAADEYFELYHEWFDEVDWVPCFDYISRAVELVTRLGLTTKKETYLAEAYNDIVKLKGDDSSLLSISLMKLIVNHNYKCDYSALVPLVERLILKNQGTIDTAYVLEHAYPVKAELYKKLKDNVSENDVYVQYAESLMSEAERIVNEANAKETAENRYWFMAENDVKKAIGLFQNHGAPEKAAEAQKRLIEIQKESVKHIEMHEFKYDVSEFFRSFNDKYGNHGIHELIWDVVFAFGFQNKKQIREDVIKKPSLSSLFSMHMIGSDGQTEFFLPGLKTDDEDNILMHMYHRAREYERVQGQTVGFWFIQYFRKLGLRETDLSFIFENNPIIPKGQEKDVQRGVYYGLTGQMSDALDKLAPRVENIIRNLAESCGDLMTYFDTKEGVQQKRTLSQVLSGENLNECTDENILFTFDGLLQQKAGSNIRNRIGHGLNTEAECSAGDCVYFVMIVLKYCAMYCKDYTDEIDKRFIDDNKNK